MRWFLLCTHHLQISKGLVEMILINCWIPNLKIKVRHIFWSLGVQNNNHCDLELAKNIDKEVLISMLNWPSEDITNEKIFFELWNHLVSKLEYWISAFEHYKAAVLNETSQKLLFLLTNYINMLLKRLDHLYSHHPVLFQECFEPYCCTLFSILFNPTSKYKNLPEKSVRRCIKWLQTTIQHNSLPNPSSKHLQKAVELQTLHQKIFSEENIKGMLTFITCNYLDFWYFSDHCNNYTL